MTTIDENGAPAASTALGISGIAAEWVADRRNTEDWTPDRQAELDAWLAQSVSHRIAYIRIEATWRRTDRLAALRRPMREHKGEAAPRRPFWRRIAVALGLAAVTATVVTQNILTRTNDQTFATAVGEHEQVTLGDGSQIELNTDTLLRVSFNQGARSITLDRGEAYFQVKHDAARPFIVLAGDHRVTDLGTQFSVRRDPAWLKVSLVEGRARFESTDDAHASSLEMSPGDEIVATQNDVTLVKKPVVAMKSGLGWRRGVVVFNNTSLSDAAVEFNRYSRTKLVFADPKLASLTIVGTFQANNIEAFADVLQAALGLRAENRNGAIVISAAK